MASTPDETSGRTSGRTWGADRWRPHRTFARHYVEMIVAMVLGMIALYPIWTWATRDLPTGHWADRADTDMLAMATAMSLPMIAWMVRRGHGVLPVAEMTVAMYAGFVVLFPLLWSQSLGAMGVMMAGHVLMPVFMLLAMLARRHEYSGHDGHIRRAAGIGLAPAG